MQTQLAPVSRPDPEFAQFVESVRARLRNRDLPVEQHIAPYWQQRELFLESTLNINRLLREVEQDWFEKHKVSDPAAEIYPAFINRMLAASRNIGVVMIAHGFADRGKSRFRREVAAGVAEAKDEIRSTPDGARQLSEVENARPLTIGERKQRRLRSIAHGFFSNHRPPPPETPESTEK